MSEGKTSYLYIGRCLCSRQWSHTAWYGGGRQSVAVDPFALATLVAWFCVLFVTWTHKRKFVFFFLPEDRWLIWSFSLYKSLFWFSFESLVVFFAALLFVWQLRTVPSFKHLGVCAEFVRIVFFSPKEAVLLDEEILDCRPGCSTVQTSMSGWGILTMAPRHVKHATRMFGSANCFSHRLWNRIIKMILASSVAFHWFQRNRNYLCGLEMVWFVARLWTADQVSFFDMAHWESALLSTETNVKLYFIPTFPASATRKHTQTKLLEFPGTYLDDLGGSQGWIFCH